MVCRLCRPFRLKKMAIDPTVLSSQWDGLNPLLIASFFPVQKVSPNSFVYEKVPDEQTVQAPLSETNLQLDVSWDSQFEDANAETKAPTLLALLQNGGIQQVSDGVIGNGGVNQALTKYLSKFEGRTGVTKLNSTQTFHRMQPFKITTTAHFRAWSDGSVEVDAPVAKLFEWALPQALSKDGSFVGRAVGAMQGRNDEVDLLMPSECPRVIGMTYKGRTYMPIVIESIEYNLDSPISAKGAFVQMAVQMTLCSLSGIDKDDWANTYTTSI